MPEPVLPTNAWTVPQQKLFLKRYGVQCSTYSKPMLLNLVGAVHKLNMEKDPDFQEMDPKQNIKEKLHRILLIDIDPWELTAQSFTTELSSAPAFSLYNIFNYLLCSRADYDNKKLKAYKSFDDYRLCYDGHVQDLEYRLFFEETYLFRTKVKPTQKQKTYTNSDIYRSWFIIKEEEVILAYCECPGGADGACRHISASLYELESYQDKIKSCTDGEVTWKKRSRQCDEPTRIEEMVIKKARYGLDTRADMQFRSQNRDVRHPHDRTPLSNEGIKRFSSELKKIDPESSVLDILEHPQDSTSGVDTAEETADSGMTEEMSDLLISRKLEKFIRGIEDGEFEPLLLYNKFIKESKYSYSERELIDDMTKGQCKNSLWRLARRGMITASVFKRVVTRYTTLQNQPSSSPLAILRSLTDEGQSLDGIPSLEWGRKKVH